MSEPDSPAREAHEAWTGPSGLRIERLAAAGGYALVIETSPAGEPLWFTPAAWADLCTATAQLGPGFAAAGPYEMAAPAARPGRPPQVRAAGTAAP